MPIDEKAHLAAKARANMLQAALDQSASQAAAQQPAQVILNYADQRPKLSGNAAMLYLARLALLESVRASPVFPPKIHP